MCHVNIFISHSISLHVYVYIGWFLFHLLIDKLETLTSLSYILYRHIRQICLRITSNMGMHTHTDDQKSQTNRLSIHLILIQEKEGQQSKQKKIYMSCSLSISIMTILRRSIIVYSCMFIEVTMKRKISIETSIQSCKLKDHIDWNRQIYSRDDVVHCLNLINMMIFDRSCWTLVIHLEKNVMKIYATLSD